jgi:hypothetical protein
LQNNKTPNWYDNPRNLTIKNPQQTNIQGYLFILNLIYKYILFVYFERSKKELRKYGAKKKKSRIECPDINIKEVRCNSYDIPKM